MFAQELDSFQSSALQCLSYLVTDLDVSLLRARPNYAGETLKCSFISTVRPTVHTILIRHQNGAFRKRSSNRRNLKTPSFCFRVDGNTLKTELFHNDAISLTELSSVANLSGLVLDGKHLMRFKSETFDSDYTITKHSMWNSLLRNCQSVIRQQQCVLIYTHYSIQYARESNLKSLKN